MVESNLQRSTILPSEKAFSYKMRLEAMNRQGQRSDLTSGPVVPKFSRDQLGDRTEESGRQVSRYIRLTELKGRRSLITRKSSVTPAVMEAFDHVYVTKDILSDNEYGAKQDIHAKIYYTTTKNGMVPYRI